MIRGILHDKGCSGRSCRGPRTFLLRVLDPGFAPFRAIWRDFRPKLVTECLFSYEFDGRLQRSWISPAHRRFGRHRNRLFKPNIGSNRTIFPISCDPPNCTLGTHGEEHPLTVGWTPPSLWPPRRARPGPERLLTVYRKAGWSRARDRSGSSTQTRRRARS